MPQPLSQRTASFTDSVIRRMTRVSLKYGAVNLSQGFPDFDPPQAILDRLAEVAHTGPHQYAVTWGAQNFREALAKKQSRFMGRTIDPDKEIVATCGSTEAMMCAMMTVTNPGDKVVVFSPFYENYGADTILSGAEPIYVPLHPPAFTFDVDELESAFRQHPKALVLCNPSNPCGRVFTREELLTIAEMATKYDVYVITDEVYEHIVYAPHQHTYFATLPGMWNRTISCSSLSKTYSITGWRLGYIIAPEDIIERAIILRNQEKIPDATTSAKAETKLVTNMGSRGVPKGAAMFKTAMRKRQKMAKSRTYLVHDHTSSIRSQKGKCSAMARSVRCPVTTTMMDRSTVSSRPKGNRMLTTMPRTMD